MADLLKFPEGGKVSPVVVTQPVPKKRFVRKYFRRIFSGLAAMLLWLFCGVRLVCYYVLFCLRYPVNMIGLALPVPLLIGFVVLWLFFPEKTQLMWRTGVLFALSAASITFLDSLLRLIAPFSFNNKA